MSCSRRVRKIGLPLTRSASARRCTRLAKARSISLAVLALQDRRVAVRARARRPQRRSPGSRFPDWSGRPARRSARSCGASSRRSSSRFAPSVALTKVTPVMLPPGRARLATRPALTGSSPVMKTIGIVVVAALAASAPTALNAAITARLAGRPARPRAPAADPADCRPSGTRSRRCGRRRSRLRSAPAGTRRRGPRVRAVLALRKPITGIAGCCARAASGQAAAAPPSSVMNSRRLIRSPRRRGRAASAARSRPSALAVLRLMTSSTLVDCMTGRSAGFSPLRIRPA